MDMVCEDKIVLVLEDEMPLLEAIRLKLEKNSFKVLKARTVEQGKQHLCDSANIDLIWLDHYLIGEEDGLDFLNWCKCSEKHKEIPVFVVSNTLSGDKIQTYLKLGANKYFTKSNHRLDEIIGEMEKVLLEDFNN